MPGPSHVAVATGAVGPERRRYGGAIESHGAARTEPTRTKVEPGEKIPEETMAPSDAMCYRNESFRPHRLDRKGEKHHLLGPALRGGPPWGGVCAGKRARLALVAGRYGEGGENPLKGLGRHLILEFWEAKNLNSIPTMEAALREAADACSVTLMDLQVYHYSPEGVTGVAILSESHITIHTWPEYGYAAVDVFTCGEDSEPRAAIPVLLGHFSAQRVQVMEVVRGIASAIE
jgi:S-adenosylmethionine decarboxylase